jgi:hypothetical protein
MAHALPYETARPWRQNKVKEGLDMKTQLILSALAVMTLNTRALATPTLYPTDFSNLEKIQNPTTSNLIADDSDLKTIYVMPPNEAYGTANGLHTLTANLLFCPQLKELAGQSEELNAKIHGLRLQLADELKELKDDDNKIEAARLEAANFATATHLGELAKLDSDISTLTTTLNANYAALDTCKTGCDQILNEVSIQQKELAILTRARGEFVAKNLKNARIYDQKLAAVAAIQEHKKAILDDYSILINAVNSGQAQIASLFSTYGAMEGGRAAFKYRSAWNENIATLRNLNPGFNFAVLNTENVKIYPGVLGVQGLPATGAVLGFETAGSAGSKDGAISMSSYPPSIDGNVVLSLLGACPMVQPDLFKFKADTDPKNMKYGMLISYDYPSTMKLKMVAHYNMYKMYTLMKSSGSNGGFFSSHSWTNTEERTYFRDAFHVDWSSQDPQNTLTDDQRMAMEREARNHMFERLFSLALPTSPDKSLLIQAAPPPAHGSVVVADSLMTACPGNVYCVAGSLVLRGLDAIFGSSSSSSSYTQIQDVDLIEEWSQSKVVMKPWITNYKMD